MEPQVQYVKTADGVSIAYYAMGQGTPLVMMNLPNSHLHMEWQMSDVRQALEMAARIATVVRYDHRGCGLSERTVTDLSMDSLILDLEAVVNRLGFDRFNLIAYGLAPPLAVKFASQKPERVARLVLWPAFARLPEAYLEMIGKLLALNESDWEFTSESLVRFGMGWSDEMSAAAADTLRQAITPEMLAEFLRQCKSWDVTNLLAQVTSPTMLVHEKADKHFHPQVARDLATAIPDARLVILDAETRPGRMAQAVSALLPFLGDGSGVLEVQQPQALPSGTAIILFADIVDSTALTERLGDTAFRDKARELDGSLRTIIRDNAGVPIEGKVLGDGVLAVFTAARDAIAAALACRDASANVGLELHLGLHAGDVIREDNNVYGGAVNIASRISGLSAPGEVLVSDTVRSLARTSAGATFEDRGEHVLKGVAEPQRVFAVRKDAS